MSSRSAAMPTGSGAANDTRERPRVLSDETSGRPASSIAEIQAAARSRCVA